jgi:hypothetical protein
VDGTVEWEEKDGLVWYKGRVYIPADDKIRCNVVHSCHDTMLVGHPGEQGTLKLVSRHYWWPGITMSVKSYVGHCKECNHVKSIQCNTRVELNPHSMSGKPWDMWSTDHRRVPRLEVVPGVWIWGRGWCLVAVLQKGRGSGAEG